MKIQLRQQAIDRARGERAAECRGRHRFARADERGEVGEARHDREEPERDRGDDRDARRDREVARMNHQIGERGRWIDRHRRQLDLLEHANEVVGRDVDEESLRT